MASAFLLAEGLPPAIEAFGRTHPLAVHLPIGLVLGAFIVESLRVLQRRNTASPFTPVALWLGALGSVAATVTGLAFAEEHGGGDDLFWHRWLGILTTVALLGLAWMASRATRPGKDDAAQVTPVLRGSLLACTLLLAWVGHLGGNMVWGEDYVLEPFKEAAAAREDEGSGAKGAGAGSGAGDRAPGTASVAMTDAADDRMTFYATKVLPLLDSRCYECHGNGKRKGGLRMDVRKSLVSKNEDGAWIAQPGDPAHSLLIERCLLPEEDDESMPPEGDRLKASELDILRKWIEDGVVMPEQPATGEASAKAPASGSREGGAQVAGGSRAVPGLEPLSAGEISDAASLRSKGINAVPVSAGASTFVVSMPGGKEVGDDDLSAIYPIAGRIEELSLARSSVSDAAMMSVPSMPMVRTVRVDNTKLTDIGITALLSRTLDAETVNLVGSGASDGVFAVLSKLPNLKRVYVFDTAVTAAGIDRFRASHPGVEVVVGSAVPGTSGAEGPPVTP